METTGNSCSIINRMTVRKMQTQQTSTTHKLSHPLTPDKGLSLRKLMRKEVPNTLPFVGRKKELESFKTIFRKITSVSSAQSPNTIIISGEAGIGKTRFLQKLLSSLNSIEPAVLESKSDQVYSSPYGPWPEIIRDVIKLGGSKSTLLKKYPLAASFSDY